MTSAGDPPARCSLRTRDNPALAPAENLPMKRLRSIRAFAVAAALAALAAALPSLDWCPMDSWVAEACETPATCEVAQPCTGASGDAWPCDREPDPLPAGDRMWCIRPPVTALVARMDLLPEPRPLTPFAELVAPLVLAPPAVCARERPGPVPGPPVLRVPHGPPQARVPPLG